MAKNTNVQNEDRHPAQDFIDDFEKLAEKHKIEKYVLITNVGESPILLYRPNNIMEITRVLKATHSKFLQQVMNEIGEI